MTTVFERRQADRSLLVELRLVLPRLPLASALSHVMSPPPRGQAVLLCTLQGRPLPSVSQRVSWEQGRSPVASAGRRWAAASAALLSDGGAPLRFPAAPVTTRNPASGTSQPGNRALSCVCSLGCDLSGQRLRCHVSQPGHSRGVVITSSGLQLGCVCCVLVVRWGLRVWGRNTPEATYTQPILSQGSARLSHCWRR